MAGNHFQQDLFVNNTADAAIVTVTMTPLCHGHLALLLVQNCVNIALK
jgi:hypothetical protein